MGAIRPAYITLDVEAAGNNPLQNCTLSIGACLVTREALTFEERQKRGLIFYAELKPDSLMFQTEAMRIGCLHLECIEKMREEDRRCDPTHPNFNPKVVLKLMQKTCERPTVALKRFRVWLDEVRAGAQVVGVTDTVFWDSVCINVCFGKYSSAPPPFGWGGKDLASMYVGYTRRPDAKLRELAVPDTREKPHRADHDAAFLADVARVLMFEKMSW